MRKLDCCCGLKTWALSIFILYLLVHSGFLVISFFILDSPEYHVEKFVSVIDTTDQRLFNTRIYRQIQEYISQNSGEYMALPITVNIILLIANLLGVLGVLCTSSLLLLPWILANSVYILFLLALLIYLMVLLPEIWFKVLLFLIVAPLLVVASSFWVAVLRLFTLLRIKVKKVKSMGVPVPATVYTPEPHTWDTPLPIWALQPPTSAWDPSYLQQIDPRYLETPEASRHSSRSRKSSSRSRTKSGDSQVSFRERQSDSMSLSEKYGGGVYESDRQTDRQSDRQTDHQEPASTDEWDTTREEDDYSENDVRRQYLDYQHGEYSDGGRSREIEVASGVSDEVYHEETEYSSSTNKTPILKRPKSRAESVVSLSDKYGHINHMGKFS